ncbi:MAG: hypothetical protein WAT79_04500 [Saprospiraceae bacterium]
MRYLLLVLLMVVGSFVHAQNTAISESQFIQIEMSKLDKHLNIPSLTLSNAQTTDLRALFSQKYAKVYKSWNANLTKMEVSKRRTEIENEYKPLVEGILSADQRLALMKVRPAHQN